MKRQVEHHAKNVLYRLNNNDAVRITMRISIHCKKKNSCLAENGDIVKKCTNVTCINIELCNRRKDENINGVTDKGCNRKGYVDK
jgi:hypothetical protein